MQDGACTIAHALVVLWSPRINVGCTSYKYSVDVLTSCFYSAQCPMVVTDYLTQHHHKCVRMAMHLADDGALCACHIQRQAAPKLGLTRRVEVLPW